MYVVVAILAFGILIADHELGHFIAARLCGVKVNEFAIGMGPTLLKKQGKETLYSLRLLPIGGFCAMEGEEEESDNPHAFNNQRRLKKFFILISGALMNFLLGFVILTIIVFTAYDGFVLPTIESLAEGFPNQQEAGLMEGDTLYSVDGYRIFYSEDFSTAMSRASGNVDIVVIRDGKKVLLENYELVPRDYEGVYRYGLNLTLQEATFGAKLKYSLYTAYDFVRLIRISLSDLITGAVGLKQMSGVVGIVSTISDVGNASETVAAGMTNVFYLCAFIAVNLSVMNMLPIPALDGGHVFFLVVTWLIEKITHKKCNPKVENTIHRVGLYLLIVLMLVIMVNDIVKLLV